MIYGVKPIHANGFQADNAQSQQYDINDNDTFGDVTYFRQNLVIKIRIFPLKNLHAADSQKRQQSYGKNNDTHTAETVQQRAPKQNGGRSVVNIG